MDLKPCNRGMDVRVAVIGTGFGSNHLAWLRDCPEFELTCLGYHENRARAEELATQFDISEITNDCANLVQNGDVEMVVIATPPHAHTELGLAALGRGLTVVADKPLAHTLDAARSLAGAAAGAHTAIIFQWRENEAFGQLRNALMAGDLGELLLIDIAFHHDFLATSNTAWPWRHDHARAGFGALGDLGVHAFDLLRWASGFEWSVTAAQTLIAWPQRQHNQETVECETDDIAMVTLAATNGTATGRVVLSRVSHGHRSFQITAVGTRKAMQATGNPDDGSGHFIDLSDTSRHSYFYRPCAMNPYRRLALDLANSTTSVADFQDGLAAQIIIQDILRKGKLDDRQIFA
jgi:predicted dehydrogenase